MGYSGWGPACVDPQPDALAREGLLDLDEIGGLVGVVRRRLQRIGREQLREVQADVLVRFLDVDGILHHLVGAANDVRIPCDHAAALPLDRLAIELIRFLLDGRVHDVGVEHPLHQVDLGGGHLVEHERK